MVVVGLSPTMINTLIFGEEEGEIHDPLFRVLINILAT
jgi:hypothetical protein